MGDGFLLRERDPWGDKKLRRGLVGFLMEGDFLCGGGGRGLFLRERDPWGAKSWGGGWWDFFLWGGGYGGWVGYKGGGFWGHFGFHYGMGKKGGSEGDFHSLDLLKEGKRHEL